MHSPMARACAFVEDLFVLHVCLTRARACARIMRAIVTRKTSSSGDSPSKFGDSPSKFGNVLGLAYLGVC